MLSILKQLSKLFDRATTGIFILVAVFVAILACISIAVSVVAISIQFELSPQAATVIALGVPVLFKALTLQSHLSLVLYLWAIVKSWNGLLHMGVPEMVVITSAATLASLLVLSIKK